MWSRAAKRAMGVALGVGVGAGGLGFTRHVSAFSFGHSQETLENIEKAKDDKAAPKKDTTGFVPTCPRCQRRRRVAVYGGAFDPVTNGHLSCAAEIVHSGLADEVLMVPCGPRPDKPKLKTSAIDRYVMLQIAVNTSFSPGFPVKVSDVEVYEPKALATYDLLSLLRSSHPGVDFMFVVGSDWLQSGQDLRTWTSEGGATGDRLVNEFDFLIIRRPGYDLPENLDALGPRFNVLSLPHGMNYVDSNVSSTEIRKRVAVSEQVREFIGGNSLSSADGLVPTGVLAFIQRQGLYRKGK
eukprot:Sspe_Gene.44375::Locus_21748_Transcript_2_2_Confidence_0.400_Length_1291::g.44375::m.44375/K00969/nadD; nicotinate-nucleotide adenylyltransferase